VPCSPGNSVGLTPAVRSGLAPVASAWPLGFDAQSDRPRKREGHSIPPLGQTALRRPDVILIACFAILGGAFAWTLIHQIGSVFFYQMFTPEALMWACGRGFRHPLVLSPDMANFLLHRSISAFDCATIDPDQITGPPGFFFRVQLYLSLIAAGLWRL